MTTSYGYTRNLLNQLAWSGPIAGSVAVELDANGQTTDEVINGTDHLNFHYDASGLLIGIGPLTLIRDAASGLVTHTALGIVQTANQFDVNDELIRSTTAMAGKMLFDQQYSRDSRGRIHSVIETDSDGKSFTTEYSYDKAGRLTSIQVNGDAVEKDSYDPAGNRIQVLRHANELNASYDIRNELSNWGTTKYVWAPDGRVTTRTDQTGTMAFVYDDLGTLRKATLRDGHKVTYLVDAAGRRIAKQIGGKFVAGYLYRLNGYLAAEIDSNGKVVSHFGYDDQGNLAVIQKMDSAIASSQMRSVARVSL